MEKSIEQVEKNVSASFGYVKKDMLMLNDAFSDLHDKMQHLSLNHAGLLEELGRLRREIAQISGKKIVVKKVAKKAVENHHARRDDLTRIEGIGPTIKRLLWKKEIDTFKKLGNRTPEDLREILEKAGPKYAMHNPSTWPRQARMADKGEWQELKTLQDKLKGGLYETQLDKKNGNKKKAVKKKKKK